MGSADELDGLLPITLVDVVPHIHPAVGGGLEPVEGPSLTKIMDSTKIALLADDFKRAYEAKVKAREEYIFAYSTGKGDLMDLDQKDDEAHEELEQARKVLFEALE